MFTGGFLFGECERTWGNPCTFSQFHALRCTPYSTSRLHILPPLLPPPQSCAITRFCQNRISKDPPPQPRINVPPWGRSHSRYSAPIGPYAADPVDKSSCRLTFPPSPNDTAGDPLLGEGIGRGESSLARLKGGNWSSLASVVGGIRETLCLKIRRNQTNTGITRCIHTLRHLIYTWFSLSTPETCISASDPP